MTAADADRAKAADPIADDLITACLLLDALGVPSDAGEEPIRLVAAALAEARAPYDRLTADLRARVHRLVEAHQINATPNGELFADRLDDLLRAAAEVSR